MEHQEHLELKVLKVKLAHLVHLVQLLLALLQVRLVLMDLMAHRVRLVHQHLVSGTSGTSALGVTSGTTGSAGANGTNGTSGFATISGTTNNGVLTLEGSSPNTRAEDNLTFDGNTLSVTGNVIVTTSVAASTFISATTFRETYSDLGTGGSATFDLSTANNFRRQFNGSATITFSNPPASNAFGFTMTTINAGAYVITWPASVDWVGGVAPVLTSAGTDVLTFFTFNGGTTYYGFVVGKNLS
jgi:hypothetical protein